MLQFWFTTQKAKHAKKKNELSEKLVADLNCLYYQDNSGKAYHVNRDRPPVRMSHFKIRKLDLSSNGLSDNSVIKLLEFLRVWRIHVRELHLNGNTKV